MKKVFISAAIASVLLVSALQPANASSGFMAQGLSNQGIIKAGYSHRIGPRGNLWTCLNGICAR